MVIPETIKKRNHFLPETYLEKFLNKDNRLYVYKKGEEFFKNGIKKEERLLIVEGSDGLNAIAVKNKLYIPEGESVKDKNIFEDFFAEEIESKYNDFLAFIEDNFFNAQVIFKKYRDYIILLIASMISRTLHSKTEVEEIYKAHFQAYNWAQSFDKKGDEKMKKFIKGKHPDMTDEKVDRAIKDYTDMISKGKFGIKIPRNLFIKHIFQNINLYGWIISDMTIQILRCKEPDYFITTDAPVVYFVPKGKENFYFSAKSLGGPYTELYFPLSKNLCLFLSRLKLDVLSGLPVNKEIVDITNDNLSHNSRKFIFSPEKSPLLEKFLEEYIPYPFKFGMS